MSIESRKFEGKSEEELSQQAQESSRALGAELVPPSVKETVHGMSASELKEKFPLRYDLYVKSLRPSHPGMTEAEAALMAHDKERSAVRIKALNNLDAFIESQFANLPDDARALRQLEVYEDLRKFLEDGGTSGYVKLPTGAGKTVVFTRLLNALEMKSLVVVPKKNLLHQTVESFGEFAPDMEVGSVHGGSKEFGRNVTVITYDSLVLGVKNGTINPADYECLILDEAHRSLSDERRPVVEEFTTAIRIGFTATPEFNQDKKVGDVLGKEIHRLDLLEAAETQIISDFRSAIVRTRVKLTDESMADDKALAGAINVEARNRAAVELYLQRFQGKTGVAYCVGISHAERMAELFNEAGISAAAISGEMSDEQQAEILADYKAGKYQVLANADLLIEGFSENKASVCLNLRPTFSRVVAEQRGGRVLRLDPNDPDKVGYIIDFVDEYAGNPRNQPLIFAQVAEAAYSSGAGKDEAPVSENDPEETDDIEEDEDGLEFPSVELIIKAEDFAVTWDSEEIMTVVREAAEREAEIVPDGWITESSMARRLNKSPQLLEKILDKLRRGGSARVGRYEDRGKKKLFISPETVDAVARTLEVPSGWVGPSAVDAALGILTASESELRETFLELVALEHPGMTGVVHTLDAKGSLVSSPIYSPELLRLKAVAEFRHEIDSTRSGKKSETAARDKARETLADLMNESGVEEDVRLALQELIMLGERPVLRVSRAEAQRILEQGYTFIPGKSFAAYLGKMPERVGDDETLLMLKAVPKSVVPRFVGGVFRGGVMVTGNLPPSAVEILDEREEKAA